VRIASVRDTGAYSTRLRQSIQRSICRFADCVLANSDAVREWLVSEGYEKQKIRVIRNGIVEPKVAALPGESSIRSEFGIPGDAPLIGMMCRLSRVKAVNDLLDAAATILKEHPETRFLIIGDGEERPSLVAQAERLGISHRVIFTGFRTDIQRVLPELTISALTSTSEGLSNTLLESMAVGLPVVATRIGGNTEIVLDTVTGLLVPPRNPVALADALGRLLADPALARQMGERGKARIENDFSVDHAVSKTQDLYLELMDRRGNQRN
jgi:glycosyltransferase involved in cell wall biosynthesis